MDESTGMGRDSRVRECYRMNARDATRIVRMGRTARDSLTRENRPSARLRATTIDGRFERDVGASRVGVAVWSFGVFAETRGERGAEFFVVVAVFGLGGGGGGDVRRALFAHAQRERLLKQSIVVEHHWIRGLRGAIADADASAEPSAAGASALAAGPPPPDASVFAAAAAALTRAPPRARSKRHHQRGIVSHVSHVTHVTETHRRLGLRCRRRRRETAPARRSVLVKDLPFHTTRPISSAPGSTTTKFELLFLFTLAMNVSSFSLFVSTSPNDTTSTGCCTCATFSPPPPTHSPSPSPDFR